MGALKLNSDFLRTVPENLGADVKKCLSAYRFGFQGQEKDDEVFGSTGTSYTAEFWQYDSRIGRRWNLDPKPNPSISSYATFANNPIIFTDLLGDSAKTKADESLMKIAINRSFKSAKKWTAKANKTNNRVKEREYLAMAQEMKEAGSELQEMLDSKEFIFTYIYKPHEKGGGTYVETDGVITMEFDKYDNLFHESKHGYQYATGELTYKPGQQVINDTKYDLADEVAAYKRQYSYRPRLVNKIGTFANNGYFGITKYTLSKSISTSNNAPLEYKSINNKYIPFMILDIINSGGTNR